MRHLISVLVITTIALISIKLSYSVPHILFDLKFDGQSNILWKYAASTGVLPYKEIFYPYGLLNYFLYVNLLANFINSLIVFILLLFLYISLNKLFKSSYALLVFVLTLFAIYFLSGFIAFARYGICAIGVLYFSLSLYQKNVTRKLLFIYGILTGFLVFLVTDQGIIFPILVTLLYFISVINKRVRPEDIVKSLSVYVWFILGIIIATTPFIIVYSNLNMLSGFISSFINITDISVYAKTPYFHSLKEPYGLISFGILYVSVIYIAYSILFVKQKSNIFFPVLGLVLCVVIFDQKSIIRYLGYQISFILPILGSLLLYGVVQKHYLKIDTYMYKFSIILLFTILALVLFRPLLNFSEFNNFNYKNIYVPNSHREVIKELKTYKDFNGKLFTFPSDPIFYILSGQLPPYYVTAYEMSPFYAQEKTIEYLKDNNISYLIYNSEIPAIQDGVPDYVRVSYLYSYIFSNYVPFKKIDNFIILKKDTKDLFSTNYSENLSYPRNYLLDINLGNIPNSEGYHKAKSLNTKVIFEVTKSNNDLNISSKDTVVLVHGKLGKTDQSKIIFYTKQGATEVIFSACNASSICIINLSRVPLFYKSRIITKVDIDSKSIKKIQFIKNDSNSVLW